MNSSGMRGRGLPRGGFETQGGAVAVAVVLGAGSAAGLRGIAGGMMGVPQGRDGPLAAAQRSAGMASSGAGYRRQTAADLRLGAPIRSPSLVCFTPSLLRAAKRGFELSIRCGGCVIF